MYRNLLCAGFVAVCAFGSAQVVINEVDYDQAGTDNASEFVELYNAGSTPVDISGWKLVAYNGTSGTGVSYTSAAATVPASTNLPAGGFYVIGDPDMATKDLAFSATLDIIQNGVSDGLQLQNATGTVMDALVYENGGTVVYTGPAATFEGTALNGGDASFTIPAGRTVSSTVSIGRIPDGADTGNNSADFHTMKASPKASNVVANTLTLPYTNDFASYPSGNGVFETYILESVVTPVANGIPASPDPVTPNSFLRVLDDSGGGDAVTFGQAIVGNINVEGFMYLSETLTSDTSVAAQDMTIQLAGLGLKNTKDATWYGYTRSTSASYGYDSGVSINYIGTNPESPTAPASQNDGVTTQAGSLSINAHVTAPDTDTNLALVTMAGNRWVPFRTFLNFTDNKFYVKFDNTVIYNGTIPAGTAQVGGVSFGSRNNGNGAPYALPSYGLFIDAIKIDTNASNADVQDYYLY